MRLALAILLLVPAMAWGQSAVIQGGPTTPGHAPMYVGNGYQTVIQDSGPASGGAVGIGLNELLVTNRGTGTPPYANAGTGPGYTNICDYDAPITNATGYHFLCFGANSSGGGLIDYGYGGGASPLPFQITINGTTYPFPFVANGIVGPSSSVIGDTACWNNTTGTLVSDCGKTAPHVYSLTALQAASTTSYPNGVWRDGYGNGNKSPPLFYVPLTTSCAAASLTNDGGNCVTSADSKAWKAVWPASGIDILQYGADPTGTTDATSIINAALTAACASGPGVVMVPPGSYTVSNSLVMSCKGVSLVGAGSDNSVITQNTANIVTIAMGSTMAYSDVNSLDGMAVQNLGLVNNAGAGQTAGAVIDITRVTSANISVKISGLFYVGIAIDGYSLGTTITNTVIQENAQSCTVPCAVSNSTGIVTRRFLVAGSSVLGAVQDLQNNLWYSFPIDISESNLLINLGSGTASYGEDFRTVNGYKLTNVKVYGGDIANFHFYPEQQNASITSAQWQNVYAQGNGNITAPTTEYGMFFDWNNSLPSSNGFNGGGGLKGSFGNVILNNYTNNALYVGPNWDNSGGEPFAMQFDGCKLQDALLDGVLISSGSNDWTFANCFVYGNGFAARSGQANAMAYGTITLTSASTNFTITPASGQRNPVIGDDVYAPGVPSSNTTQLYTTIATVSCSAGSCTGTLSNPAYANESGASLRYGAFYAGYKFLEGQRISVIGGGINCGGTVAFGIATFGVSGTNLLGLGVHGVAFSNFGWQSSAPATNLIGCIQPMLLAHPLTFHDDIGGNFSYPGEGANPGTYYQVSSQDTIYMDPINPAVYVAGSTGINSIESLITDYTGRSTWAGRSVIMTFVSGLTIGASGTGNISTGNNQAINIVAGETCTISFNTNTWYVQACYLPPYYGTTASIGGSSLTAGTCAGTTLTLAGAVVGDGVVATPSTYPGDGFYWTAYVSGTNAVTVKICAAAMGTPTASVYNVRVLN